MGPRNVAILTAVAPSQPLDKRLSDGHREETSVSLGGRFSFALLSLLLFFAMLLLSLGLWQAVLVSCLLHSSNALDVQGGFIQAVGGAIEVIFGQTPRQNGERSTNATNLVFAHHMVGNTYNYDVDKWTSGNSRTRYEFFTV